MSEHTRTSGAAREGASPEDIRRRLEGRAEVLDAARTRYAGLESVLSARGWKRRLRARPELVPQWLAHEPAVIEALERARRRADSEGWPAHTPVRVVMRELEACRGRLEALTRKRLSALASPAGPASLEKDLPRLDVLVRRKAPLTLGPGEVLVFEGQQRLGMPRSPGAMALLVGYILFVLLFFLVLGGALTVHDARWLPALLVVVSVSPIIALALRSGRVWLTSERLLWQPVRGEPVAVPLASIPDGGIHLEQVGNSVRVEGDLRAQVRHLAEVGYLSVLLELHRQPPLLGAARAGVRLSQVAIYPATLVEGNARRSGHAVLRPDGVAFIPSDGGAAALEAVTGRKSALPVEAGWVLEQLRWLSDTEFDACVARVVEATRGQHWSAWEASYRGGPPVWKVIHITRGAQLLRGRVDWAWQDATERMLRSWPRSVGSGRGARGATPAGSDGGE